MNFFVASIIILFSITSHAERWVVENMAPQSLAPEIQVLKRIQFSHTSYTTIEIPTDYFYNQDQPHINQHKVYKDVEVFLPETLESELSLNATAWHVENLAYDELPVRRVRKRITVAIIDTGVDHSHEYLSTQMWKNRKEIAGNGKDDDGNGYVDDIHGWNMNAGNANSIDDHNHGSHCAGIVASLKNEKSNAQGIAPMVKIMALKVFNRSGRGTSAFLSDVAEAIKYAVDNKAHVLSNSWGGYDRTGSRKEAVKMLSDAISYAEKNKVIFVASAGNNSQNVDNVEGVKYPVGLPGHKNLVGVAAYDNQEQKAYFSNYGLQSVHVAAPGVQILSTVKNGGWANMSGTSMSAPVVSGLIARGLSDGMTYDQVLKALKATARPTKMKITYGLIDPLEFLNSK